MQGTSNLARVSIGDLLQIAVVLWTIYSWAQHTQQAATLLPLWLYRVINNDRTAFTDALLCFGSYVFVNGLPSSDDVLHNLLPSWILEERVVELQIFAMTSAMAIFAGFIVHRGEDSKDRTTRLPNHVLTLSFVAMLVLSLWINDIRTIQDFLQLVIPRWLLAERPMELQFFSMVSMLAGMAGLIAWRGEDKPHIKFAEAASSSGRDILLPPLLIPSRSVDKSLYPEKASLEHPYLSVGVPIGWTGCAGCALSSDVDHLDHVLSSNRRRGWFDVEAKDHLSKGDNACLEHYHLWIDDNACLEHKLQHYLREQGVSDDDWSSAYLVTSPKVFGYSSSPVSFWYIYDEYAHLNIMILEVNKTLEERRTYLLRAQPEPPATRNSKLEAGEPADSLLFSNAWQGGSQVSPFKDHEAAWTLRVTDPIAVFSQDANNSHCGRKIIDNMITLATTAGKPKLTTHISSDSAIEPSTISSFNLSIFLARWFFITISTLPHQAWTHHFKTEQQPRHEPSPLLHGLRHHHKSEEVTIERFFRTYLQTLVSSSPQPLRLSYEPPASMGPKHHFVSAGQTTVDEADEADIHIRVLSSVFYSRFVHYSHTREALDREGLVVEEENRTLFVEGAERLTALLDLASNNDLEATNRVSGVGVLEQLRWKLLAKLRCPAPPVSHGLPPPYAAAGVVVVDIRPRPLSQLDRFVQRECEDRALYRRAIVRLFLADRCTGGSTAVLGVVDFVVRTAVVALAMGLGRMGFLNVVNIWGLVRGL